MYQFSFINKLEQFSYVSYDLILTDDAGIMPDVRLSKEFKSGEASDLDAIGAEECVKAEQDYRDAQTRQWVIDQIQGASDLVNQYIQSANPDLTTLGNVDAIINPVLGFYGLPASVGLQPLLQKRLQDNTDAIIAAFKQLPITDATVPTTAYFVAAVKQALGITEN